MTEIELQLAERICRYVPCAEKVLLCITGSEATTYAVRIATGADGADTPFLTVLSGNAPIGELSVAAELLPE